MATLADDTGTADAGAAETGNARALIAKDRAFFFYMALAIAATVVTGFSLQFLAGRSSLASPWWVHLHGLTFMGWLGIYLTQNWLIYSGRLVRHARVGKFAAGYVGWMVLVGLSVNTLAAINHRVPPFFELNTFLVMDWATVLVFAGLTWAAVRLSGASDWHKRLMLCGAMQVMTPGIGRLVPLPLIPHEFQLWAIWACLLPFIGAAVIYDLATRKKVHPAYAWGFGAITLAVALMRPIAFTAPMLALTHYLAG